MIHQGWCTKFEITANPGYSMQYGREVWRSRHKQLRTKTSGKRMEKWHIYEKQQPN